MRRIRIGNDFEIFWKISLANGEPYNLEGKDLILLLCNLQGSRKVDGWTVKGNTLHWAFRGKDQKATGAYRLELVENNGDNNMHVVDVCEAFTLVSTSCMVGGDSCSHLSIETIELQSVVDMTMIKPIIPEIGENGNWRIEGVDTGKPSRGEKGEAFTFNDFTPEQISQLQKPALDAAKAANAAASNAITTNQQVTEAERLRVTAESGRAEAEKKRETSETARGSAENLRAEAETLRVQAESGRVKAEQSRVTNETNRGSSESLRVEAEGARVTAEQKRTTAEEGRVNAESLRSKAEDARKTAEESRVTAEQGRANAEALRVEAEGARVTESATAVKNANDATLSANTAAWEAKKQGDYAKEQGLILNENNKKYDTIKQTVDVMEANGNAFTLDIADGKRVIANAITKKGVFTREEDSYQQMATNISQIYKGAYDEMFSIEIDDTMPSPEVKRNGSLRFPDWLEANAELLMVKDGKINYVLDRTTAYKRKNGLESKVDGTDGDIMVKLPKFWYSPVETATGLKFTFSETYQRGDGWVESPEIWIGATEGVVEEQGGKRYLRSCFNMAPEFRGGDNNASWDTLTKSLLGMPRTSLSHDNFRDACTNKGSFAGGVYHQFDYRTYVKLNLMFMCIYGTRNWQASFSGIDPATGEEKRNADGFKYGGLGEGVSTAGEWWGSYSQSRPFIMTNVSLDYGLRSGVKRYVLNIGTAESEVVKTLQVPIFLGIANPFGHIWKAVDGITKEQIGTPDNITDRWALFTDPAKYVSGGQEGAAEVIDMPHVASGWIKKMSAKFLPKAIGGAPNNNYGDYNYTNTALIKYAVFHGGHASSGADGGGFCVVSVFGVGDADASYGGRLCFSPS